ncbi:MAG: hypothetical protein HQL95_07505 [Magnetococcales bacterium]|nr:hypothetical protein [Magnetococcales bacterium]
MQAKHQGLVSMALIVSGLVMTVGYLAWRAWQPELKPALFQLNTTPPDQGTAPLVVDPALQATMRALTPQLARLRTPPAREPDRVDMTILGLAAPAATSTPTGRPQP